MKQTDERMDRVQHLMTVCSYSDTAYYDRLLYCSHARERKLFVMRYLSTVFVFTSLVPVKMT